MKRILIALIFLTLLSVSCTPIKDRRTLNDMEALMPERPDSALAVLRGLQPRDLPGLHVRPLHALLLSEALDKNYIDLTDDSLALAANRYYGEHGSKLHRLKSWYYLGRIRFNEGNYAEAVICYNKALDYAEALTNYHYMGLINREIANAYSTVWDDYHAIDYIKESIDSFELAGESRYVAYSELALARMLLNQKEYENSIQALDWIFDNSTEEYLNACASEQLFLISLSRGKRDYQALQNILDEMRVGTVLAENASRLSNIALFKQLAGQTDSSEYYINKASQQIESMNDSICVVYNRFKISDAKGDFLQAKKYLEEYLELQDPSIIKALEQSVSYYQGYYYQNESQLNALKARNRFISYGSIVLILSIVSIGLLLRNKRQKELIIEEMTRANEVQQELSAMKNKTDSLDLTIATLFENRIMLLQALSEQYDIWDEKHLSKKQDMEGYLSKDDIIASFRSTIKELRGDGSITFNMAEILNVWKDDIIHRFSTVFGENGLSDIRMTKEDFELIPYYFSGMKQKTISFLTGYTEASIKERKRRIKQKIEALGSSFYAEKKLFLGNL